MVSNTNLHTTGNTMILDMRDSYDEASSTLFAAANKTLSHMQLVIGGEKVDFSYLMRPAAMITAGFCEKLMDAWTEQHALEVSQRELDALAEMVRIVFDDDECQEERDAALRLISKAQS